jgi:hypothetical protein
VKPFPALLILNNYDGIETVKRICDELITDMYVVSGLTYITLEKEDLTLDSPNIMKVFSFTRGLEIPDVHLIDDLIEAKYGTRFRFFGAKDSLNTILSWQSPGIWRAGVQFLQYELKHDMVNELAIEAAIEFSKHFADAVSSITTEDFWRLKSNLKKVSVSEAMMAFENLQALHFETCVQEVLWSKYGYTEVITRYKPPYLKGREIDVYARKGLVGKRKNVTICECKLKFGDTEVCLEEIKHFLEVVPKVRQYESELAAKEGGSTKTEVWLITNSKRISRQAVSALRNENVRILIAKLPSKWYKKGDWQITSIKEFETRA